MRVRITVEQACIIKAILEQFENATSDMEEADSEHSKEELPLTVVYSWEATE